MTFTFDTAGATHVGQVRRQNQDAHAEVPEKGFVLVADGMGGGPAGDVASRMAVDAVVSYVTRGHDGDPALGGDGAGPLPAEQIREAILVANGRIHEASLADPDLSGMGTTMTALSVDRTSGRYVIGHVGDSRAYRWIEDELHQLTRDHTWVQSEVQKGTLTPGQAQDHPLGHILSQVLGVRSWVSPDTLEGTVAPGESFLLCTDGVTGVLSDDDIADIIRAGAGHELDWVAEEVIRRANAGGAPDNVTVSLLRVRDR